MPGTDEPHLSAALEAALLHEIREQYRIFAHGIFRGSLRLPQFELVPTRVQLGRWVPATRTIELSRPLVLSEAWGVVLEVLKHEMAHQFVSENLGTDEPAHGPVFRSICERFGIDASARGMPDAKPAGDKDANAVRIGERIAKLLALAESPNVHEAEAAMAAAQKLLLKHNLELQAARTRRGYVWKHLGKASGRTNEAERTLSLILLKHFFVEAIWIPVYRPLEGKRGSILEISGTEDNVAIAEYVHGFLVATAERLWREHKAELGIRSDRERRTFLAGVMTGMKDKLAGESTKNEEAGLVWVADANLSSYFRGRYPHVRHVRYGGHARNEHYDHGREAGQKIVIHKGMGQATAERGLLLPPRR